MMSTSGNGSTDKSQGHIDRWLWQSSSAPSAPLLFLIPIILALAISQLFPQIPKSLRSDPIGYQERLSAIQVQFKNWTPFLESIGAFHVEDTLWFRLLLAGLAFVLFVSLGKEVSDLLKPQPICQPTAFYLSANTIVLSGTLPEDQIAEAVQDTLESKGGPVRRQAQESSIYLYSEHAAWARVGTAVTYLGLLFLVAGLAANGRWGWQQVGVQVPPNEPVAIGPEGNHWLQLVGIEAEPSETLTLQIDGSRTLSIRWGTQNRRGSFRYEWLSKGGPFVQIQAQGANGEKLTLYNYEPRPEPATALRFAFFPQALQYEEDRLFIVADAKVVGRLVWLNKDAGSDERLSFHLWTFGEDRRTPIADQEFAVLESDDSGDRLVAEIGDVTYVLDVRRYVIVNVAYRPGLYALWIGSILCAGGVAVSLIPRRQTWAVIVPGSNGHEVRIRHSQPPIWRRWRRHDDSLAQLRARISRN